MTARTIRTRLAIIVAPALLAAACGDDDGEAVAPADQSSETDNQPDTVEPDTIEVDEAALQAVLDEWRTDVDAFGAALSIRVPGHDDIHLASGVDDRDPETPMPTGGTYSIMSVTKTFVTATALQLVDEGRLSLDEPVEPWLPELPNADEITLAMLLGHTAGLGDWDNVPAVLEDLARSFTAEEVVAENAEAPPYGQPGEHFAYTNGGYAAVGLMIERELDQDLAAVIEERFAHPLSLNDTFFIDDSTKPTRHGWFSLPDDPDPDLPLDYLDFPPEAYFTSLFGSAGMASSSEDMLGWGEALYSGDLLSEETTASMLEMRSPFSLEVATDRLRATDEPTPLHYGLGAMGFCLDQTGCSPSEVDLVGHSGQGVGTRTLVAHHPESGTTIVVHANLDAINLPDLIPVLPDVLQQLGIT